MIEMLSYAFPCAFCVFLYRFISPNFQLAGIVILSFFWLFRFGKKYLPVVVCILVLSQIPMYSAEVPSEYSGRVIGKSEKTVLVQNGRTRILVYTNAEIPYNSEISFDGEYSRIESSSGFFSFDYSAYYRRKGVYYSVTPDNVTINRRHPSLLNVLYKRIQCVSSDRIRIYLNRVLLGRKVDDFPGGFLLEHGFSFVGILSFLDVILCPFADRKLREKILFILNIALMHIYMYPLILVQMCLFRVLAFTKLRSDEKLGIGCVCILLLYPEAYVSASFLIPVVWRIAGVFFKRDRWAALSLNICMQSLLFQSTDPFMALFYPIIRPFFGAMYVTAVLQLLFPHLPIGAIFLLLDPLISKLSVLSIPGTILGAGLPFFAAMVFVLRKSKRFSFHIFIMLLLFLLSGAFHPFAEITFLNVGQGDCILIREPWNRENILIDTGKPIAYSKIQTMLEAKGIRNLDVMIITHSDSDHAGNLERIQNNYHPSVLIQGHHLPIQCGKITLADLNEIACEDENESSLVECITLNKVRYLLMGDADSATEESILKKYNELDCDVLKLSHHGSKSGSCDRFLDAVKPSLGIVSAGDYGIYHHPASEVLQRLAKRHIPWMNTNTEGDITILCFPMVNLIVTSSLKIGIIPVL